MSAALDDDQAWRLRRSNPRLRPALRSCIGPLCRGRRSFRSEHAGERLCPRCKACSNALYGAFDSALPA